MTKKQDVELKKDQLPTDYEDQFAGEGTFVERQYSVTPQVRILHALSPQCLRSNPGYIEGAQAGMILLTNAERPLIPGNEGVIVQPCVFSTTWVVTTDRAQGQIQYISEHSVPQPDWKKEMAPKGNFFFYRTPEGHVANEAHDHYVLVHDGNLLLPYGIRFRSTGIFVSKQWNGLISNMKTATGKPAARFGRLYQMKVGTRTNAQGEWGTWIINVIKQLPSKEAMEAGQQFRKAFEEGQVKIDADEGEEYASAPAHTNGGDHAGQQEIPF